MKLKLVRLLPLAIGCLLLTSCFPSGNIVGSAQVSTNVSNFADPGDIAYLNVNGGAVTTPNGIRYRLNKASFSIPSREIFLSSIRFNEVITENIPKSDILNSRLKGKNTCAYVEGVFKEDGQRFQIWIIEESGQQSMFMSASAGGLYDGAIIGGKLQIGGRNLCRV